MRNSMYGWLLCLAIFSTAALAQQPPEAPARPTLPEAETTHDNEMTRLLERLSSAETQNNKVIVLGEPLTEVTVDRNDYLLAPGDIIRVLVFQNPDMTLETRISEDGTITYPLIGVIAIGGLDLKSAETRIAEALENGGFLKNPQVNIVLGQIRGNQVSVLGQVNRPGRYPLETFNLKVSDLLALAGGITPSGSDTVIVSGTRNGEPFRKEIDLPTAYVEGLQNEDMKVAAGDVIYVNQAPMFYIYGEVQRPGRYRIERDMTVQQALATGGGITARGTERWLRLDRKNANGAIEHLSPNWSDPVLPNDVIYVRESIF